MHEYLSKCGIENNNFMLRTYDCNVVGLDPYDPNLTDTQKQLIIEECSRNIFYFFRDVLRIPQCGGDAVPFNLDRTNCPQILLSQFNISTFVNKPRQLGNTISTCALILYYALFYNSSLYYKNRLMDDEIYNKIVSIYDMLPDYIKSIRKGVVIRTLSEYNAFICYFDDAEYLCFLEYFSDYDYEKLFNRIRTCREASIYSFYLFTSAINDNSVVFNRLVNNKNTLCWNDNYYDNFDYNKPYNVSYVYFVYIQNSYEELGKDEKWFEKMSILLNNDKDAIRRELLMNRYYNFNTAVEKLLDGKKVTNNKWNGRHYLKVHNDKKIYKYTITGEMELYSPFIDELQGEIWYDFMNDSDKEKVDNIQRPMLESLKPHYPYSFMTDDKGCLLPPIHEFNGSIVTTEFDKISNSEVVKLKESSEEDTNIKTFGYKEAMKAVTTGNKIARVTWNNGTYVDLSWSMNNSFNCFINKGDNIRHVYIFTEKDINATDWFIYK